MAFFYCRLEHPVAKSTVYLILCKNSETGTAMAEELQSLLDKIQRDGVEKAEAESRKIVDKAKQDADEIRKKAEHEARTLVEKARNDANGFVEKGKQSLEQAARDIILSISTRLSTIIEGMLGDSASAAMSPDIIKDMLLKAVSAYCADGGTVKVLVKPDQAGELGRFVMERFREKAGKGIEVVPDRNIDNGFRILLKNGKLEHDFSDEAIRNHLASMVRPHIAEILKRGNSRK